MFFGQLVGFCWTVRGEVFLCKEFWVRLCAHPAGVTVCPSRRCDCASIQGDVTVHPGGCDWVPIQEGVPVCPSKGV